MRNVVLTDPTDGGTNSSGMTVGAAFVAPILVCLIFGLLDGVRAVWAQSMLQFTADQIVRWGQVHTPNGVGAVLDYARRDLNLPSPQNASMTLTVIPDSTKVAIQVRYTFTFWAPKVVRVIVPGSSKSGLTILYATAQLPV